MRLIDLQPWFVTHSVEMRTSVRVVGDRVERVDGPRVVLRRVEALGQAMGLLFLCPRCLAEKNGVAGETHSLLCWFTSRNVPDDVLPAARFDTRGTSLSDLSLEQEVSEPSCGWHGKITAGTISQRSK